MQNINPRPKGQPPMMPIQDYQKYRGSNNSTKK